jgi:hypothetical protein
MSAQHQLCGLPPKKIPNFLQPIKDNIELKTPGVYSMPCKCGQVCIGQTRHSIKTRFMEHRHDNLLEQPDRSAVAELSINLGHHIKLQDTTVLYTKVTYMGWMTGRP